MSESSAIALGGSVRLTALLYPEGGRRGVDAVHGGSSVVDGGKNGLHVLREPERGLRERVEAIEFFGRQPHIDRLHVVFELRKPPRAADGDREPEAARGGWIPAP